MKNQIILNFEMLYNDLREIVILVDELGTILNLNNTALNLLFYERIELINNDISIIGSDKTLENVVRCELKDFNTNLCSKHKKLIPITGKLSVIKTDSGSLMLLKMNKIDDNLYKKEYIESKMHSSYSNFIKDINGKYIYVNENFAEDFNLKSDEVIQKFDFEILDKEQAYKAKKEDLYVISSKKSFFTITSRIADGRVIYYEKFKSPMFDDNNNVVSILGIHKDITESVKLINNLLVQNEQLSIIYKIINNSYTNLNINCLFKNLHNGLKALLNVDYICVHIYDYKKQKLAYCTSFGQNHKLMESYFNVNKEYNFLKSVFDTREPVPMTEISIIQNKYGDDTKFLEFMYYSSCYPLVYDDDCFGVITFGSKSPDYGYRWDNEFMKVICKNIAILLQNFMLYTQLKENLESEKEKAQQLNLYFDTTTDFFCIVDNRGKIKKMGKQMLKTLGYTPDELKMMHISKIIDKDDLLLVLEKISSAKKDNASVEIIEKVICKNSDYRIVDWNIKYLDDRGIYICSGRDLTSRVKLEEDKRKVEESLQLEKLKSEFLSSISHELRTPITIIYGAIHNIENNLLSDNDKKDEMLCCYIKNIKKNNFRLQRLFDNIIEITNIDAGFTNLNLEMHNIVKVVEDISLSISKYLLSWGVSLIFDTDIEEKFLLIDVEKIERVMLNLISNSVKYSRPDKKTEIFVNVYETKDKLCISVKDNGIGIEESQLGKIFDRFIQTSDCMTRNAEGSGLGLYLVKTLLQIQNADISVISDRSEGSEFIIEFDINSLDYAFDENEYIEADFAVKSENFDREFSDIAC